MVLDGKNTGQGGGGEGREGGEDKSEVKKWHPIFFSMTSES